MINIMNSMGENMYSCSFSNVWNWGRKFLSSRRKHFRFTLLLKPGSKEKQNRDYYILILENYKQKKYQEIFAGFFNKFE